MLETKCVRDKFGMSPTSNIGHQHDAHMAVDIFFQENLKMVIKMSPTLRLSPTYLLSHQFVILIFNFLLNHEKYQNWTV